MPLPAGEEPSLAEQGCVLFRGLLGGARLAQWRAQIDDVYARIRSLEKEVGPFEVGAHWSELRYQPTADSFALGLLDVAEGVCGELPREVRDGIEAAVGGPAVCDIDLSWARRQQPPKARPQWQAPHSFHQDGACGHDFQRVCPRNGLVPMATLWIPLVDCGSTAPGLELELGSAKRLRSLERLTELNQGPGVYSGPNWWRPELTAGDAVLMAGHVVHRTHSRPNMSQTRTCVELRFVSAAVPPRFAEHRLLAL